MKFTIKISLIFSIFTAPLLSMEQEDPANKLARVPGNAEQCAKGHFYQAMSYFIQELHFDLSVLYNFSLTCKDYNESFNRGIQHFMEHKFDNATFELASIAQQYIAETDEDIKKIHANRFKNIFYIDPTEKRRSCIRIVLSFKVGYKIHTEQKYSLKDCIQIYSGKSLLADTSHSIQKQKLYKYNILKTCFEFNIHPLVTQIMLFDEMVQESLKEEKEDLQKNSLTIPILSMGSPLRELAHHGTPEILPIILPHLQIANTNLCHNKCLLAILNSAIVFGNYNLVKAIMKPNYNDRKAILELFLEKTEEDGEKGRPSTYSISVSLYALDDTKKYLYCAEGAKDATLYCIKKNKTERICDMIRQSYYAFRSRIQILKICASECSFEQKIKIATSFLDSCFFPRPPFFDFTKKKYEAHACETLVAVLNIIYEPNANIHHAERQTNQEGCNPYAKIFMLLFNDKKDISTLMPSLIFCSERYAIAKKSNNIDFCENYRLIFNALAKIVEEEQTPRDIDKFIEAQSNIKSFILGAMLFAKLTNKIPQNYKALTSDKHNSSVNKQKARLFFVGALLSSIIFSLILPYIIGAFSYDAAF